MLIHQSKPALIFVLPSADAEWSRYGTSALSTPRTERLLHFLLIRCVGLPRARFCCRGGRVRSTIIWPAGSCWGTAQSVIVVLVNRLEEDHLIPQIEHSAQIFGNSILGEDWSDDHAEENDKQHKVQDGVAYDTATTQLGLLHRVDWRPDLTTKSVSMHHRKGLERDLPRAEPEEHHGMQLINLGNQDDREHDKQDDVTEDEIGGKHAELGNLAEVLTSRL